jgi:hypothetical protein
MQINKETKSTKFSNVDKKVLFWDLAKKLFLTGSILSIYDTLSAIPRKTRYVMILLSLAMSPMADTTFLLTSDAFFPSWIFKVEEKRENFSLRKPRKSGERERQKYLAPFFEISHTKREKNFLWENWEILEKEKKKILLLFSSTSWKFIEPEDH